jgi:predicted nucleotidyltransferase
MGIDQQLIDEIVRRVTSVVPAQRIILFGSAATGEMTRDSDIDLLVIEDEVVDPWEETLRVRKALMGLKIPFDIVMISRNRFEESKEIVGGIAYPAHKYGRVIYAAA